MNAWEFFFLLLIVCSVIEQIISLSFYIQTNKLQECAFYNNKTRYKKLFFKKRIKYLVDV